MNRIDNKFSILKGLKKKAFIAYVTAGDPSLGVTEKLVLSFEHAGVDIVELGIPFSDPMADGPVIQEASERVLKNGVTIDKIFQTVKRIRRKSEIPIALMTYYNPVFHYGESRFFKKAKSVGVDGLIVPDLPPEEGQSLIALGKKHDVSTIFFLAPTTRKKRIKRVDRASTGFIYYVSLTGVTGARKALPSSVTKNVRAAKRLAKKPICVGFGVSRPEQVKMIARMADGVIVGSAIIKQIVKHTGKRDLIKRVSRFVSQLSGVLK